MEDFYREKKDRKPKKDVTLGVMIAVIVFTVLFVMISIFFVVPALMDHWWAWLNGYSALYIHPLI